MWWAAAGMPPRTVLVVSPSAPGPVSGAAPSAASSSTCAVSRSVTRTAPPGRKATLHGVTSPVGTSWGVLVAGGSTGPAGRGADGVGLGAEGGDGGPARATGAGPALSARAPPAPRRRGPA